MSHIWKSGQLDVSNLSQAPTEQENAERVFEMALFVLKDGDGIPGQFESAFSKAEPILTNASGYRSHCLTRCLEVPGNYALFVDWKSLSHHVDGFRNSTAYPRWKELLNQYVQPETWVRHFSPVLKTHD